jgi:multiple sugar transport system permease protein
MQTQYGGQWSLMMAASLILIAPIVIAFFLAQRQFVEGISISGFR